MLFIIKIVEEEGVGYISGKECFFILNLELERLIYLVIGIVGQYGVFFLYLGSEGESFYWRRIEYLFFGGSWFLRRIKEGVDLSMFNLFKLNVVIR